MDVSEKKLCRKTLAQDVFERRWSLDGGKDNDQNISATSLTFTSDTKSPVTL